MGASPATIWSQRVNVKSRPLNLEFPGAVYHITSRCDRREAIYRDEADRLSQFEIFAHALDCFRRARAGLLPDGH